MNSPEFDKVKNEIRRKAITDRLKQINLESLDVEGTLRQIKYDKESGEAGSRFDLMIRRTIPDYKLNLLKAEKAKLEAELEQL